MRSTLRPRQAKCAPSPFQSPRSKDAQWRPTQAPTRTKGSTEAQRRALPPPRKRTHAKKQSCTGNHGRRLKSRSKQPSSTDPNDTTLKPGQHASDRDTIGPNQDRARVTLAWKLLILRVLLLRAPEPHPERGRGSHAPADLRGGQDTQEFGCVLARSSLFAAASRDPNPENPKP